MDKVVSFKFRGFQTENFEVDVETAGKLLEMQAELIHKIHAQQRLRGEWAAE